MSSLKLKPKKVDDKSISEPVDYLERKYGKEPPISKKELKEWNWH
jgi:hypothetical protein